MATTTLTRPGGIALDTAQRATLRDRLERAVRRARRRGDTLAAVTIPLPPQTDPSALVVASRRAGEDYACLEQPAAAGSRSPRSAASARSTPTAPAASSASPPTGAR